VGLRWRDPRAVLGLAVTALFVWLSLRGVPFHEVGLAIAHARWGLLLAWSVPSYLVLVWVRALRWRHLTDPIRPLANAPLSRATAVGFMVNNLFPLRMGEVVRCWYLARETCISAAATFGTVILERVIDTLAVIAMVLLVLPLRAHASDAGLTRGALLLVPVAVLPILGLWGLRVRPALVEALVRACLRPFPARFGARAQWMLHRFAEGLGALRGGRHLAWIAWHTVVIWLVISVVPILAAFEALAIELPSAGQELVAAWTTQAAIGVAVALPSSPGFFGLFHYACRVALVRSGVPTDTAVAAGTLIHSIMWLTLTALGLCVLRWRRTSLAEVDRASADA
jgi:uncharacterized protein (TIRG00374 family)